MAVMIDLRGSSANMENLLRIRSGPANRLKETVQQDPVSLDTFKNVHYEAGNVVKRAIGI